MKRLRAALTIAVLSLAAPRGSDGVLSGQLVSAQGRQPAITRILQAELQRNMEVLARQPVSAYYGAYTLHDTRTTQIVATFGAVERSDDSRERSATIEVRVGDYALDNTRPMRGDARAHVDPPGPGQPSRSPTTSGRSGRRCGGQLTAATSRRARR